MKYLQYGLGVVVGYDMNELRWHKKTWVPEWLFRWFATPDMLDLLDRKMAYEAKVREDLTNANIRDLGRG